MRGRRSGLGSLGPLSRPSARARSTLTNQRDPKFPLGAQDYRAKEALAQGPILLEPEVTKQSSVVLAIAPQVCTRSKLAESAMCFFAGYP